MSVQLDKITAETFDSVLRFTVPSRSNPHESYLVDVSAYNGQGTCQCMHWQTRLEPLVKRGETGNKLRCAHILAAREQFTDETIKSMTKARAHAAKNAH